MLGRRIQLSVLIRLITLLSILFLIPIACFSDEEVEQYAADDANRDDTQDDAEAVVVSSPGGLINSGAPTITWGRRDPETLYADNYTLQVATDSDFVTVVRESTTNSKSFTISPALKEDGIYFLRVRLEVPGGTSGLWSPTISFTVDLSDPAIVIHGPLLLKSAVGQASDDFTGVFESFSGFLVADGNNDNSNDSLVVVPDPLGSDTLVFLAGEEIAIEWEIGDTHISLENAFLIEVSYDKSTWTSIFDRVLERGVYRDTLRWTPPQQDSPMYFRFTYGDNAGNVSMLGNENPLHLYQAQSEHSIAPETTLSATPDAFPLNTVTTYDFQVSRATDGCIDSATTDTCYTLYEYKLLDAQPWIRFRVATNEIISFQNLDPGEYNFNLRAVNLLGLVDLSPEVFRFTVDHSAPVFEDNFTLRIISPITRLAGYSNSASVIAVKRLDMADDYSHYCVVEQDFMIPDHPCFTAKDSNNELAITLSDSSEGEKTLYLWLRDPSNNISQAASASIIIDTQPPSAIDVQLADIDATPIRHLYTNNTDIKIKAITACTSDVKRLFVRASLSAATVVAPTASEISGNVAANSMLLRCSNFYQTAPGLLNGLILTDDGSAVDLKITTWAIDNAGNVSEASNTGIQWYTGGHFFNVKLNSGQSPVTAEKFDIQVEKVDSDNKRLHGFNGSIAMAYQWLNDSNSIVGDLPAQTNADANLIFSGGAAATSDQNFVLYNIARGSLAPGLYTVLQVTAALDGNAIVFKSDSFDLVGAPISTIEIIDYSDFSGVAIADANAIINVGLPLFAGGFDAYGNFLYLVMADWSGDYPVNWAGENYISSNHFSFSRAPETEYFPTTSTSGARIKASYNFTDANSTLINLTDVTGIITVLP